MRRPVPTSPACVDLIDYDPCSGQEWVGAWMCAMGVVLHHRKGLSTRLLRSVRHDARATKSECPGGRLRFGRAKPLPAAPSPSSMRMREPRYCLLAGRAKHPRRRMRVVNDLRRRRDPKGETSIGERARKLDVVEEDRVALVEDVVIGEKRPPQEQTTRRGLRYRSRL